MEIRLNGRIDSNNAPQVEKKITEQLGRQSGDLILDASGLEYISSAGLRILLRLRKEYPELRVINDRFHRDDDGRKGIPYAVCRRL